MLDEIKEEIRAEIRKEFEKDWQKDKAKHPHLDRNTWWEERRLGMKIFLGVLMGVGIIALVFLFGWVLMLLWNWLMPAIFGLTQVTYWQAWGLLLLSMILFKGFNFGSDHSGSKSDRRRKKELRHYMESKCRAEEDENSLPEQHSNHVKIEDVSE